MPMTKSTLNRRIRKALRDAGHEISKDHGAQGVRTDRFGMPSSETVRVDFLFGHCRYDRAVYDRKMERIVSDLKAAGFTVTINDYTSWVLVTD